MRMTRQRLGALAWLWALLALPSIAAAEIDFVLPDLDGGEHRLSDYRGKWVLVNYWATWCPPCLEEMPELEMFHETHKDKDAVVLGINLEQIAPERLRAFVDEQFISYPILRADPDRPGPFGPIRAMPTSFLVGPRGELRGQQVGTLTAEQLEVFIASEEAKQ
jgi:thiol-disulfide isomerase/thioredoxin